MNFKSQTKIVLVNGPTHNRWLVANRCWRLFVLPKLPQNPMLAAA